MPTIKSLLCPSISPRCPERYSTTPSSWPAPTRPSSNWSTWWISCTASTATKILHADGHRDRPRDGTPDEVSSRNWSPACPIPAKFEVRFGRAADEIVLPAKEDKVDLVVMGSHGRSGITHLLVGSVAECPWCATLPALCWWSQIIPPDAPRPAYAGLLLFIAMGYSSQNRCTRDNERSSAR